MRLGQRHVLRELARKAHALPLLVWLQMDIDSAFFRSSKRDHRRIDDKFAADLDRPSFDRLIGRMQNPMPSEEYVVVSGKHTFNAQYTAVLRRLRDLGLLNANDVAPVVKPGLVNLIPQPNPYRGRVDNTRRNISIR